MCPEDVAAPPADAEKTASGLASKVLKAGSGGEHPSERALVTVHYTGWTTDGNMFDSSIKRNRAALFGLNQVVKGWTEGVQLMTKGESRRFWIPPELGYGENPGGGRPGGMLVFEIELVDFKNPPTNLTPPDGATKTESGLAYTSISGPKGGNKPTVDDTVTLQFIAWDAEGNMTQTSYKGPRPLIFRLEGAIPGWKEALQTMTVGETSRFWMPADLVPIPNAPKGLTIFDFELLKIDAPLPAPSDVAAAPSDATKTDSGLAYKVLAKGTGVEKPDASSVVSLSFTVWTPDGKMKETTTYNDRPAMLPVGGIPFQGLKEAVLDMVEGEKRRLWIPQALTMPPGSPRAPESDLVYDVELVEIKERPAPPRALGVEPGGTTKLPPPRGEQPAGGEK